MQPTVEFIVFVTFDQLPVPVIATYESFTNVPVQLSKLKIWPARALLSSQYRLNKTSSPASVEFVWLSKYWGEIVSTVKYSVIAELFILPDVSLHEKVTL